MSLCKSVLEFLFNWSTAPLQNANNLIQRELPTFSTHMEIVKQAANGYKIDTNPQKRKKNAFKILNHTINQ